MAGHRLSTPPTAAPLDAYLRDLAGRLRGPRRRREQILAELADGLEHAITNHTTAGLPDDRAVTAAIAQFGTPQAVAEAFAGELATGYARRTIAWYIATGPLVGIWWLLLLQPHPWRTSAIALLVAIPVIPLIMIAIATAAGTLATTGRLIRWLPEASPRRALTATITIAALALIGDLTVIADYTWSAVPWQPLAAVAIAASLTRTGCGLVTIRHATAIHQAITATLHGAEPPVRTDDARR
jgi:roadblock/LC7 domain-containing protein